jgi:hypothetical protein
MKPCLFFEQRYYIVQMIHVLSTLIQIPKKMVFDLEENNIIIMSGQIVNICNDL